jgi:hypothetical protein
MLQEEVAVEGLVESFVLALGLRMVRAAMKNPHAQSEEPDREAGVGADRFGTAPRRTVVTEQSLR